MYQGKFQLPKDDAVVAAEHDEATVAAEEVMEETTSIPEEEVAAAPAKAKPAKAKPAKRKKKRIRWGSVLFYTLYFLMIPAFFMLLGGAMEALESWLIRYEASQPTVKCQEVFQELFDKPDWEALYDQVGMEDTKFENKAHFAAYMKNLVGDTKLTFSETSAGLSGDHKYIVKCGDEKIGVFTLTSDSPKDSEIRDWKLGDLELMSARKMGTRVQTKPGRIVYINGVALDKSYVVQTTQTKVEEYLPEDVHGIRTQTVQVDGLLVAPEVTASDAEGNPITLNYDPEQNLYVEPQEVLSHDDYTETIVDAATAYCKYMIRAIGRDSLRYYFDRNSDVHDNIYYNETWMQSYSSYELKPAEVHDFYQYSDELFSARVVMSMLVTRWDDTVKEYNLNTTFFFTKLSNKWLCTEMTNVDLTQVQTQVKLSYYQDDTLLGSEMVDSHVSSLTPPAVTVPEGKQLQGWFRQSEDDRGSVTYSLVFQPNEDGTVSLAPGTTLEPMTLYAMFETKGES